MDEATTELEVHRALDGRLRLRLGAREAWLPAGLAVAEEAAAIAAFLAEAAGAPA